jgi:hypothetical protein
MSPLPISYVFDNQDNLIGTVFLFPDCLFFDYVARGSNPENYTSQVTASQDLATLRVRINHKYRYDGGVKMIVV